LQCVESQDDQLVVDISPIDLAIVPDVLIRKIESRVSGTKRSLSLGMHGLSNAHNSPERLYKHQ
jgi:hypothetical protein